MKGDKAEVPDMYLSASIKKVETTDGTECWIMSADKCVKDAVENAKLKLTKRNCRLTSRYNTPMATTYHTRKNTTKEMNADVLQVYQELIGILQWAVEIVRVEILLEVSLLSSQLELPHVGHLQAIYRVFGYLKKLPKCKLYFDRRKLMISEDRFHKFD